MSRPLLRADVPSAPPGQVIGLLGGSFDPAHEGHLAITRAAFRSFGLDRIWWLVSPGNPQKSEGPAPMERRIAAARALICDPKVTVTAIETALGTRYTADTLAGLRHLWPGQRFVWLMGSDNLAGFHRWDRWQEIAAHHPIGVLARPGSQLAALSSPAARSMARARLTGAAVARLGRSAAPAWALAGLPLNASSSTAIRNSGAWTRQP